MKKLKLVVNNKFHKSFFDKNELQTILNIYAKMVSMGEWKDYGLSLSKNNISFNVYKRFTDNPIFQITKNFSTKNKDNIYNISDTGTNNTFRSRNLNKLIEKMNWNKLKLVK